MNISSSDFERLEHLHPSHFRILKKHKINSQNHSDHQLVFEICDESLDKTKVPTLGLFGGVHGIESIGVQILHRFLEHILSQTQWNESLRALLKTMRIVGIPIVNPVGYRKKSRSNGNGVDLMRNAPIQSDHAPFFLGGQSISSLLPYFKGHGALEAENQNLIAMVQSELFCSPFSISLDLHSGFGLGDFLWTPWAKSKEEPPFWNEYQKLKTVLDSTLRHHVYKFEQQSQSYCTHGDVWDHLMQEFCRSNKDKSIYLPLTLEVGSWIWLKKSPSNAFRIGGLFNPLEPHRERRVLRRHLSLLNLLLDVAANFRQVFRSNEDHLAKAPDRARAG
jgi:Zinc carboxypeptidase